MHSMCKLQAGTRHSFRSNKHMHCCAALLVCAGCQRVQGALGCHLTFCSRGQACIVLCSCLACLHDVQLIMLRCSGHAELDIKHSGSQSTIATAALLHQHKHSLFHSPVLSALYQRLDTGEHPACACVCKAVQPYLRATATCTRHALTPSTMHRCSTSAKPHHHRTRNRTRASRRVAFSPSTLKKPQAALPHPSSNDADSEDALPANGPQIAAALAR